MASLHQSLLLELNADSAEFCHVPCHTHLLAVGTYQLQDNRQDRIGMVYLYTLSNEQRIELRQSRPTAGVFDMKWNTGFGDTPVLGLALANGHLQVLQPDELEEVWCCEVDSQVMLASVSWSPHVAMQAAVSDSGGGVAIVQARESEPCQLHHWQGHELEAWAVEFDRHQGDVVYSGGDDCVFRGWDVRDWAGGGEAAAFTNRKSHSAGVCCISSHPTQQHLLLTGSYDETVRCWDTRQLSRPVVTCEVSTGGGVWRLKWHPEDPTRILAACMYNGFAVLRCQADGSGLDVIEQYTAHQSIAYGASWFQGVGATGSVSRNEEVGKGEGDVQGDASVGDLVATCSFYDNLLHLWTPSSSLSPTPTPGVANDES